MRLTEKMCLVAGPAEARSRELSYLSQIICCNGDRSIDRFLKVRNMCKSIPDEEEEDGEEIISTRTFVRKKTREGEFFQDINRLCGRLFL